MIYIPFIWFLTIFIYIFLKRGLDVSAYAALLFVVTSFFSILLYNSPEGISYSNYPSFLPTVIYCIGNSILILPLYKFNSNQIKQVVINNEKTLVILTYIFFIAFVLGVVLRWRTLVYVYYADWETLRRMAINGELNFDRHTGILAFISLLTSVIGRASSVMIPIFFVSLCYLNRSRAFNIMALLGSANVIVDGIIWFDRSSTFKWLLLVGLCTVLFWRQMPKKAQRRAVPILSITMGLTVVFFVMVTIARFDNTDRGTQNSVINYAGQSYLHFCNIYDNLDNGEGVSAKYLFPTFHSKIMKDYEGNVPRQQELTMRTGIECGVFYSVLGSFVLDANQIGPFLYVLLYSFIAFFVVRRRRKQTIGITQLLACFFLMQVPVFGIIAYVYTAEYTKILMALLLIFFSYQESHSRSRFIQSN